MTEEKAPVDQWEAAQGPPCPACGHEMFQVMPDGRCPSCWRETVRLREVERENAQQLLDQLGPHLSPHSRGVLRRIARGKAP